MAMSILVLQSFAVQRRATGCGSNQEPAGLAVASSPGQIANALETKH